MISRHKHSDRADNCRDCGNLGKGPLGLYVCNAERLPDPDGQYQALPTRTGAKGWIFWAFGQLTDQRARTEIQRAMAPGPVEGFSVILFGDRAGQREPATYHQSPCPAWRRA